MARILMHPLVGIDPDCPTRGKSKSMSRLEPLRDKILNESFAELEFNHFRQPSLADVENQQTAGDLAENSKLREKGAEVSIGKSVVKRLVPSRQGDLAIDGGDDDKNDTESQ